MTSLKKYLLAAVLGVLALVVFAVPWYLSRTLDAELKKFAEGLSQGDLVLSKRTHDAGLFTSSGRMEFQLRDSCEAASAQDPSTFALEYAVSHVPSTQGWMRFDWSLIPQGNTAATIEKVIGPGKKLSGTGALGFSGLVKVDLDVPELNFSNRGVAFQVTASKGSLSADKTAAQFVWNLQRFVARGHGDALDMQSLALNMDLKDRTLGTGTIVLDIGGVSTASMSMEGLQLRSQTSENKDRLDSQVSESVRVLNVMGQSLKDLALEARVTGLHAPSVSTLLEIGKATCGFGNMTAQESLKVRKAVETLLVSGMSVGIPTLKGSGDGGQVSANVMLELLSSSDGTIALEKHLRSSGQLSITGTLLNPGQTEMALATGFASKVPDGLKASFAYQDGLLKVSDKTLDGAAVKATLAQLDRQINNFLHPEKAVPTNPLEELVQETEMSAPAPAAAPAQ